MTNIKGVPAGVVNYLDKAEAMAKDIAMPKTRFVEGYLPYYQTPITYYHYDAGLGFWGHSVHHYHHENKNSSSARKADSAVLLGTVLTVAAGVMLYSVGAEYSKLSNAMEDLKKFERDKKFALMDLHQANVSPMKTYYFENITQLQKDILQTYKNDSETRLVIKGTVTAGCAMGAYVCAKAFFNDEYITQASPTVGLISTALALGGGMSWMLKSGLDSTSESVKRKAQDLLDAIQNINASSQTI